MALFTKSYLQQVAETQTLNESTRLSSQSNQQHDSFDIFICHSFMDQKIIRGLYLELTRKNYKVYVDWIVDPHLNRNNITKESAEVIRKRLRSSKSLLMAFSANASLSKWMPWELGYVDGHTQQCAIVPIAETSQRSYDRSEYLLLYPVVMKEGYTPRENEPVYVSDNQYNYVDVGSWVRGNKPSFHSQTIF